MGTEKRQRQKQGRQQRLEAARAAQVAAQRRSKLIRRAITAAVVVVGAVVVLRLGAGDDDDKVSSTTSSNSETPCPNADGSSPKTLTFSGPMMTCIEPAASYLATVSTNQGDFTFQLDAAAAPTTVNNFVSLARYHFYDGATFHRIIPGFMDQGGDPTGNPPGTGGPGYTIADELPADGQYPDYSVAMANNGPDTNGSQFFVVAPGGGAQLETKYSRFGQVTTGQETVDRINALGTPGGTPTEPVTINTVDIDQT